MADASKGPRITTQTASDLQAPSISFAPIQQKTGMLQGALSGAGGIINSLQQGQALLAKEQKELLIQKSASGVVQSVNQIIDKEIPTIGEGNTPTQAIAKLQGIILDKLSNSDIPLEKWGGISTLLNGRLDTLGKQHYMEVNNMSGVIDGVTGEWRPLVPPGANIQEELVIQAMAKFPPETQAYLGSVAEKQGQGAVDKIVLELGRIGIESKFRSAAKQEMDYTTSQLGLTERLEARDAPKNKAQFMGNFTRSIVNPTSNAFMNAVEAGADADATFATYEKNILSTLSELEADGQLLSSKTTAKEVSDSLRPMLDAQKALFIARSTKTRDEKELTKLKLEVGLEVAHFNAELPLREKLLYDSPAKLQALSQTAMMLDTFKEGLGDIAPNLTRLLSIDNVISPLAKKDAVQALSSNNADAYSQQVSNVIDQLRIVTQAGEGNVTMNADTLQWLISELQSNPFWEEFQTGAPQAAAALLDGEKQLSNKLGK